MFYDLTYVSVTDDLAWQIEVSTARTVPNIHFLKKFQYEDFGKLFCYPVFTVCSKKPFETQILNVFRDISV